MKYMQQNVQQNMHKLEEIGRARNEKLELFDKEYKYKQEILRRKHLEELQEKKLNAIKPKPNANLTPHAKKLLRSGSSLYKFINSTFNVSLRIPPPYNIFETNIGL